MYSKSKKTSLLILGITSILLSRAMLFSLNDPEGPNLLVVMVMSAIVYFLSLVLFLSIFSTVGKFQHTSRFSFTDFKRILMVIFIQIIIVVILYFCLK